MTVACRAYGLRAIDGPFGDFSDPDGYTAGARRAAALGIEGKWAIHPSQIALANEIFSPPEKEVDRARRIIDALKEAESQGKGAASLDGKMIDAASERMARNVLATHDAITAAPLTQEDKINGHSRVPGQGTPLALPVHIPRGGLAYSPEQAAYRASEIGGDSWVVKAQIHSGARGKAGGIKLCSSDHEIVEAAEAMLGRKLVTHQTGPAGQARVSRLYVEEAMDIERRSISASCSTAKSERIMVVASAAGGMEIEEIAEAEPDSIIRATVDPGVGMQDFQAREIAFGLGSTTP